MVSEGFFSGLSSKKEILKTGKFLLGFAVLFLFFGAVAYLIPLRLIELFFAKATVFVLGFFGQGGKIVFQEPVLIEFAGLSQPIAISYLCTGLLEMLVVLSAVISSFGVEFKKRFFGAIAGVFCIAALNTLRIVASVWIIIFLGLDTAVFSHDLLFRVFLFIAIAGYYFVWFWWATGKTLKPKNKNKV